MPINPYANLSMQYPSPSQGGGGSPGGGGWYRGFSNMAGPGGGGGNPLGGVLGGAGQGAMVGSVIPGIGTLAGALGGAGLSLLGGIFGGIASGKKEKEKRKAFEKAQRTYQSKASQLFPELSRESFQYQNPQLNNAIQSALMYRMGNMYGGWGMPEGMTTGLENMNQFFSQAWPGQQKQLPSGRTPTSRRLPQNAGPRRGGWREDFRRSQARA